MDAGGDLTKDRRAAIVCVHVAHEHLPILRATRDEPLEEVDSGWQFLCGTARDTGDPSTGKVWAVYEVLELEPSLRPFIEYPAGTVLTREYANGGWTVGKGDGNGRGKDAL